uniref:Coiled-coil domain-containing protein 40 n=1 Tax=Lygus hesperus TaxID=30085 RepID=A0A0A9VW94_LYGHE
MKSNVQRLTAKICAMKQAVWRNFSKKVEEDSLGLEAENKLLQSSIIKMYGAIKDCDGRKLVAQQTMELRLSNYNMIMKNKAFWAHRLKSEYFKMERLDVEKNELLASLDHQRHQLQRLEQVIQQLEREVEKKHITLNLGEEERNKLDREEACLLKFKHNLDLEVDGKVAEMEKLKNTLNGMLIEKQVTEKGIGHLQREIRKLGEINRNTEEKIVDCELALAKALLDVERARSSLLATRGELEKTQRTARELDQEVKEATSLQRRYKGKLSLLCAKHTTLERRLAAKNRADPKNAIGENESSTSWAETKMKRMQDALKLVTELTKKLSDGWFNLQNVIMKRKDDRARQIHQLNIRRKHCHTMESCKIRIERNIGNVQHTITKTKKEISKEQRLFERWQGEKAKASDRLVRLTANNTELEVKFVDDVSEAEKEARHVEGEIDRLRTEIVSLGKETTRLQSELLEAEKRKDLAEIAKAKIDRFQSPGGEIGQLKQEIHRMEVRYSHLKKAQEKLMVDLEMCITRRDRLLDNAEAREVRSQATGKQWSRMQVQRKMNDLKNKIQTLKRKNQMMNREQLDLSYQLAETREEYNNIKSGIDTLRVNLEELERQMEEGQLHKHACLESTLYRQKKAKYLEDYKFGRYRCVNRTPGALAAEEEKQNHLMNTLRTVLDNLLNDFPQLNLQIAQIMNTLEPVFPDQRESENGETRDLHAPELLTSLSDRKFVARKSEYHLISDLALVRPQTVWGDAEEVQRTT